MARYLTLLLAFVLIACNNGSAPEHSILPTDCTLREGDVVFRRGSGMTSRVVIAADRIGDYSHVGIVVDSAGVKMIVHAVPGEPDFEGDIDRVKMDKPEQFFSSVNANHGEVRRHHDSIAARKAAQIAVDIYRRGTPFDHDYDDQDTTKMYCTELVTFSYAQAGVPFINMEYEHVDFLMLHADCILPAALQESKQLYPVAVFP